MLFSARVVDGVIIDHLPGEASLDADFEFKMTNSQFLEAIENPYVLLNDALLGDTIFINLISAGLPDSDVLYDGVGRNIFRVVPEPATVVLLGLGALMLRRKRRA